MLKILVEVFYAQLLAWGPSRHSRTAKQSLAVAFTEDETHNQFAIQDQISLQLGIYLVPAYNRTYNEYISIPHHPSSSAELVFCSR